MVDARGLPVRLCITPGQIHDMAAAGPLLADMPQEAMLLADKGYDADSIRQLADNRNAWANIPPKSNRKNPVCFSPYLYRKRNLVERFFNKIKHFRAIATRYDASGANYLAALKLVAVRIWLRFYESTTS
jgi:transposase